MLVEVNRLDALRQLLASRLDIASLQLKALAGMAPDAPLALRGDLAPSGAPLIADEAIRQALTARPDLDAARADVAMGAAKIRKERAEGRWDASVNVGYQRQDFGFDLNGVTSSGATRPIQDVFHYFGAGVSIVLPVRNRNQGNIAAASAEAQAAERRLQFAELTVRQEVAAALAQYAAARRSLEIYERGVRDVATRNLTVVRQTYALGRGSLLDVIADRRRVNAGDAGPGGTSEDRGDHRALVDAGSHRTRRDQDRRGQEPDVRLGHDGPRDRHVERVPRHEGERARGRHRAPGDGGARRLGAPGRAAGGDLQRRARRRADEVRVDAGDARGRPSEARADSEAGRARLGQPPGAGGSDRRPHWPRNRGGCRAPAAPAVGPVGGPGRKARK